MADDVKRRLRDEVADLRREIGQLRAQLTVHHCCCPRPNPVWLLCPACGIYYSGWHTCYSQGMVTWTNYPAGGGPANYTTGGGGAVTGS